VADRRLVARAIAEAFLAGEWLPDAMAERAARVIGARPAWLSGCCRRLWALVPQHHAAGPDVLVQRLADLVLADRGFTKAKRVGIVFPALDAPAARSRPLALVPLALPELDTPGALAAWLEISPTQLEWFAGTRGGDRNRGAGPLRHYRFHTLDKGGGRARVIEAPRPRLRAIQRRVLRLLLDSVPVHSSAHGFVRGRSAKTFASIHTRNDVVIRIDLEDFFSSIPARRIHAIFATLGYSEQVARALTGVCTVVTPPDVVAALPALQHPGDIPGRRRLVLALRERHLPQGAPTSPTLSNLAALGLDRRLGALAETIGARFSRYADDVAFSGGAELARRAPAAIRAIGRIVSEEGFRVNPRKVRVMKQSQRQELAGIVVNAGPSVRRSEYDVLRAILTNCFRLGPETQNRAGVPDFRAHLAGRVGWVAHVSPQKGAVLERLYERIVW
jgi:RNA-directed DNA polymerase